MRRFLWLGIGEESRDQLVNWEICCKSNSSEGLRIGNLRLKNLSLLVKWIWQFLRELDSLWHRVVKQIHESERDRWDVKAGRCFIHHSP